MLINHLVDSPGLKDVHYIPNFVSEEEEQYILRQVRRLRVLDATGHVCGI